MGTPHQSTSATLGNLFFKVASLGIKTNWSFIQDLKQGCDLLEDQMRSYLPISDDFDTIYCYETRPTPPLSEVVSFLFCLCIASVNVPKVVPHACAVVRGAPPIGIQQSHIQMVKFSSNNAKGYKDISLHLKEMVGKATAKVEANWAEWDTSNGEHGIPFKSFFSDLISAIVGLQHENFGVKRRSPEDNPAPAQPSA